MIKSGLLKRIIAAFTIFMLFTASLFAESVFLKDGSIVEGKIVKEDDLKIDLQLSDGVVREIERANIIRTLYHGKYKDKKFINRNDGTELEAYIIDEDAEFYIIRKDLQSSVEIKIAKDEVRIISKERIIEQYNVPAGYYLRGIVPGWGQVYSGHEVKGTIFAISFLGSATWAIIANINYKKSKDKYNTLTLENTEEEFDRAYNKEKKDGKIALVSIITTSVIYALNWGDIVFFSKPESDKSLSIYRYGDFYVNVNLLPDYKNYEYIDYSYLKAEFNISMKF